MVKIVQSMYRNVQNRVTVNGTFSEDFMVQVRLHQGSVSSPLLFIIRRETPSREIRLRCPEERLYADELTLINETVEDQKGKLDA